MKRAADRDQDRVDVRKVKRALHTAESQHKSNRGTEGFSIPRIRL
jgi:hypothetical protein